MRIYIQNLISQIVLPSPVSPNPEATPVSPAKFSLIWAPIGRSTEPTASEIVGYISL